MALDRYGDVLPRSILKPRSAGDGNPVYVALSFADEPDLVRLQDAMRQSGIKAEWQEPGLFHCSLLILEDATDEQLAGLLEDLSLPVRFWVEVASLGTFEADDIPLIANVVASPALIRLQQEFAAAALRMHLAVFEFFRATAWKPHITLGYDSDADIEELPPIPAIIKLRAEAVLLMRDDYNVVRRILLPETMPDRAFIEAGGKGSGHFGHAGIPGHQGGSLPNGESQSSIADQCVTKEVAAEWLRVNATNFNSEDRDRMAGFLAEWGISIRTMYGCMGGIVTDPPAGYTSDGRWYNRPELDNETGKPTGGSDLCDGVFCPWDASIHLPENLGRGNPETFRHTFCHEYGHLVTGEFWGGGGSEGIYTRIRERLASMTIPQRIDFYRRTGLRPYSFFEGYGEFRADSFMASRLGTPEQREAVDRMWRRMDEGVPSTWRTEPEPLVAVWEPIERNVDGLWLLEYIRTEVPETLARSCPLYLHEDPHRVAPGVITRGGPGSGFYEHAGRPGEVGGSLPSGEVAEETESTTVGRNPWESTYHRPDGTLDMEAIGRDVARAVAERPSRESHGRTSINAFFLVNGRVYSWDQWQTIPPDEMSQAIGVHSHSADNWQQYRQMHNEGKPETFAPLNSADIALMFRNFMLHRMGPASIIIMGDGRMESLEILPDTDGRALRMREARLRPILHRDYADRLIYYDAHKDDPHYDTNQQERELLHQFASQYGLGYQVGRWREDPLVVRHYGPGPHPGTGTPQSVHGGGSISGEARLVSGIGPRRAHSRARYKAVIVADGIAALAAMPQTQTWQPVWEGLEAIDRVHRMPDYMPDLLQRTPKPGELPFERSRSEIRTGGYWQINGDGAKKIGIDLEETAGYAADPSHPQLTTAHEVAHFLDNVLFGDPQTGGRASMGKGARVGPPGMVETLDQQFEDVIATIRESVDYQALCGQNLQFFTVEGIPGQHFEYPYRAAMRVRSPVEMFARGYSQWIALRSGNSTMRTQIDYRNELADRGAPRLQWRWDNFEPIAGAYDRLFRAAGLLRSTP